MFFLYVTKITKLLIWDRWTPMDIVLRMTLRFPTVLNAGEFQSLELCNGEIWSPYR